MKLARTALLVGLTGSALIAQNFTVTNGTVAVELARSGPMGSPRISKVTDLANLAAAPFTFQTGVSQADLWRIELLDKSNSQFATPLPMEPSNATMTGVQVIPNVPSASAYIIWWQGVRLPAQPAGESVDIVAVLSAAPGESVVSMDITVQPTSATPLVSHSLFAVEFPRMVIDQRGGAEENLSMPVVGGWLMSNPSTDPVFATAAGAAAMIEYPGYLSMQWFSYYSDLPGSLYFGTRDPGGYRKEYIIKPTSGAMGPGLMNSQRHVLANNTTTTSYTPAYTYVLGAVGNDWYDGARYYREWATNQSFVPPTMSNNADFSPILRDASVFATYGVPPCAQYPQCQPTNPPAPVKFDHSNFQYWKRDLDAHTAAYNAGDIPSFVYNWDESSFDSVWGEWLPVRPQFVAEAQQVAAANQPFAPYFLNMNYSDIAPFYGLFTNALMRSRDLLPIQTNVAVSRRAGDCSVPLQTLNQNTGLICYTEAITQQYTNDYAGLLAGAYGATGIYLDVFTNDRHVECYNASHNHPVGGGNWNVQARKSLVDQLRTSLRDNHEPEFYTYSESQHEMFLQQFELVFEHATGDTIGALPAIRTPLFETVYHDYQLTSNVLGHHFPMGHCRNSGPTHDLGRWFYSVRTHFGGTPFTGSLLSPTTLLANRTQPTYARFFDMTVNYVDVLKRANVRDLVTFGQRRRNATTTAPMANVMSATVLGYSGVQPVVMASTWARPELNSAGVLLQNWSHVADQATGNPGGNQTVTVTIDTADLGLDPTTPYFMNVVESNVPGIVQTGPLVLGPSYTFQTTVNEITGKFVYFAP